MKQIKNKKEYNKIFFILILILLIILILSIGIGSVKINFIDTFKVLLHNIPFISEYIDISEISNSTITIINNLRLPRILLACIVGIALATSGSIYQGTLKNSMADSYTLGISSGAALGATISIIFFNGNNVSIFALIISLLVTFLIYVLSSKAFKFSNTSLILLGMNINYFLTAIISLLMILNKDKTDQILFWTIGSFVSSSWNKVIISFLIILPCIFVLSKCGKQLNAISCGEDFAKTVGINTSFVRKFLIIIVSLITSVAVSFSGIIGFVGLMIPHLCKLLFGGNYKYIISISSILGAIFLVLCDTASRTLISPTEIPIGIITSIIGAPYLIYLIINKKKKGELSQ